MSVIFWLWRRCDWCGKVSFLGLGWIRSFISGSGWFDYCSGICAEHKRTGFDVDSGDKAKGGLL